MAMDVTRGSVDLRRRALRYRRPDRWSEVPAELDSTIAHDELLAAAARSARAELCADAARQVGVFGEDLLDVVLRVRRERFVLPDDIAESADDIALPLDPAGNASVSAPHAYLLSYALLDLSLGDVVIELGTGTGYGAALARDIVGPHGWVETVEIDPSLHHRAKRLLGANGGAIAPRTRSAAAVRLWHADGRDVTPMLVGRDGVRRKITITYAVPELPLALVDSLSEGSTLVAPVGPARDKQTLVRVTRKRGRLLTRDCALVRYVPERHAA
jgi:protein-L-isoaspartate(D-aspartate) O-methyltransferase